MKMDENIILVVDYDKICRLCLRSTCAMSDIFDTNGEISLKEQILCVTALNAVQGDGLPSKICYKCRYIVELCCELRDMVTKANKLLMGLNVHDSVECLKRNGEDNNETTERRPSVKLLLGDRRLVVLRNLIIMVHKGMLRWFRHVECMEDERLTNKIYNAIACEKRSCGLPRLTYEEQIKPVLTDEKPQQNYCYNTEMYHVDIKNQELELFNGDHNGLGDDMTNYKIDDANLLGKGGYEGTKGNNKNNNSTQSVRKAAPKHLTCQICLCSFATEHQVCKHVETHYADSNLTPYLQLQRPYECEACEEANINKKQLILHHRQHLNVNPFTCKHPGCSYVGKNQNTYRHHALTHACRSVVCERCGARFRRRWELQQHAARAHKLQRPALCPLCNRLFRNVFTYKAHMRTHEQPPRFSCTYRGCPKAYRSRAALAAHARAHAAERAHRCHLCDAAAYTSASLLNRHIRMHERARISKCDKCPATFEEYGAFYRHRMAQHGPWRPHRCSGCNRGYQSETQLEKHTQQCQLAIGMQSYEEDAHQNDANETAPMTQQIIELETEELINHLKGQSILVQPGNIGEINKDGLVGHELPPGGLLYIEVEPETD